MQFFIFYFIYFARHFIYLFRNLVSNWPYFGVEWSDIFLNGANSISNMLYFLIYFNDESIYIFDNSRLNFLNKFLLTWITLLNITAIDIFTVDIDNTLCYIFAVFLMEILLGSITIATTQCWMWLIFRWASRRMVQVVWARV